MRTVHTYFGYAHVPTLCGAYLFAEKCRQKLRDDKHTTCKEKSAAKNWSRNKKIRSAEPQENVEYLPRCQSMDWYYARALIHYTFWRCVRNTNMQMHWWTFGLDTWLQAHLLISGICRDFLLISYNCWSDSQTPLTKIKTSLLGMVFARNACIFRNENYFKQ